jgi:hypothetical protein
MIIAIAGNKCDLPEEDRRVSEEMGIQFSKRNKALF